LVLVSVLVSTQAGRNVVPLGLAPSQSVHFANLHVKFIPLWGQLLRLCLFGKESSPSERGESNYYCIKFPCIFIEIVVAFPLARARACVCAC
jgi:hypothetical protein